MLWFLVVDFVVCSIYDIFCGYHLCSLLASCCLYLLRFWFVALGSFSFCYGNTTACCFWDPAMCTSWRSIWYPLSCNINRGWCVCLWYIWLCPWLLVLQLFMKDLVVSYRCLRSGSNFGTRLGFLVIIQYSLPSFEKVVTRYVFFSFCS